MKADDIKKAVVIGAGIMGIGIGQNLAQAGLAVSIIDTDRKILGNCLVQIELNLKLLKEYGLLWESVSKVRARIRTYLADDLDDVLKDCDFVIEAIPEILQSKRELFARLDSLPEGVILSSNTSSFTVSSLTDGMRTPQRVVGLHYFNPAHIVPLVEVHRGKNTSPEVIEVARQLMLKAGKKPVILRKEVPGFIINRIQAAIGREASALVDEGVVTAEELDTATKASLGFRMACIGLMENCDLLGLDTVYRAASTVSQSSGHAAAGPPSSLAEKVKKGELGVKTGRGWYDYTGKTMVQVLEARDRKLLRQLALFKEMGWL